MRSLASAVSVRSRGSGVEGARHSARGSDAADICDRYYECVPSSNPNDLERKYEAAAERPKPTPTAIARAPKTVKPSTLLAEIWVRNHSKAMPKKNRTIPACKAAMILPWGAGGLT